MQVDDDGRWGSASSLAKKSAAAAKAHLPPVDQSNAAHYPTLPDATTQPLSQYKEGGETKCSRWPTGALVLSADRQRLGPAAGVIPCCQ
eukprot:310500-Prymnesium_polylepis.1